MLLYKHNLNFLFSLICPCLAFQESDRPGAMNPKGDKVSLCSAALILHGEGTCRPYAHGRDLAVVIGQRCCQHH